jgi:hypothetical protein
LAVPVFVGVAACATNATENKERITNKNFNDFLEDISTPSFKDGEVNRNRACVRRKLFIKYMSNELSENK